MRVDSSVLSSEIKGTSGTLFGSGGACDGDMAPATSTANGSEVTTGDRRVPLKTILQNFLNHVESLEARKREGDDGYEKEFQSLKLFSDQLKCQADFSCSEGERDVNRKKNRYKDILPFDYTRVALTEYPGIPGSDYTNANFIKGASGSNAYIACQGPLPHTVNDFWRMVVECEVQVIVMACNEQEAGKHKCEKYWRDESDESSREQTCLTSSQPTATFGKYDVTLLKSREICPDFLVRTMRLRWKNEEPPNNDAKLSTAKKAGTQESSSESSCMVKEASVQPQSHSCELDSGGDDAQSSEESSTSGSEFDEERTVCQFHYSAWPDHGIPLQVKPLLEMVRLIRDCQASETLPVLIHCSAGCGRTGTICAIDFIWGLLRTGKLSEEFSLYSLVRDMRKQRIAMVQTVDQYVLVHRAVKELFLEQLKVIDAHPYENVDGDGHPISIGETIDPSNESVVPDYETIFVKGNEEHRLASSASSTTSNSNLSTAVDFDRILNQKMIQAQLQRQKQNNLRKGSTDMVMKANDSASSSDDRPPNPPPKQRNLIDSKAIDSRQVIIPDSLPEQEENSISFPSIEPALFEPPTSKEMPDQNQNAFASSTTHAPGPQKFKKGNLRLTQTEDGAWKLQELESELPDLDKGNETKKSSPQSKNSQYHLKKESKKNDALVVNKKAKGKKDKKTSPNRAGDDVDSPKAGELLRKPSIKKIRAFFNKDKQQYPTDQSQHSSPSTSSSSSTTCLDEAFHNTEELLNPIQNDSNDRDIALAISKLPKIEQSRLPQLQMVEDPSTVDTMSNSKSVPNSLDRRACSNSSVARKSSPDERKSNRTNDNTNDRPILPVKRSKSMRAGSMSPPTPLMHVTAIQGTTTSSTNNTSSGTNMPSHVIYSSCSQTQYTSSSFGTSYNSGDERSNNNSTKNNNSLVGASDDNSLCCETAPPSNGASKRNNKHYFGLPSRDKSKEVLGEISPQQSLSTEITRAPLEVVPSPPPKPKRWNNSNNNSVDYANASISSGVYGAVTLDNSSYRVGASSCDASKSHSMTDFSQLKQQLLKSNEDQYTEAGDSTFLESNLIKLQARKELSGNGQGIGIDDTKRTMKDCQDYLMASFDMAEREGERLATTVPVATTISSTPNTGLLYLSGPTMGLRPNRSAESSPMATMQKKSVLQQREQLFSSHSSPSSSYNKYNIQNASMGGTTSIDKSPAGMVPKSGSNPPCIATRKNYCSPLSSNHFETTDTRNLSKKGGSCKTITMSSKLSQPTNKIDNIAHQYENVKISSAPDSSEIGYSDVAMEAQRKVSAAVVAGGPKARERRNSFREAVQSGGNSDEKIIKEKDTSPINSKRPKKPYESIWFGKGGEECFNDQLENDQRGRTRQHTQDNIRNDPSVDIPSHPVNAGGVAPLYANTVISAGKLHDNKHRHYDNASSLPSSAGPQSNTSSGITPSGGYEPVTFKDGKALSTRQKSGGDNKGTSDENATSPGGLQCVSLVNEIMNSNRALTSAGLNRQTTKPALSSPPSAHNWDSSHQHLNDTAGKCFVQKQNSNSSGVSNGSGNTASSSNKGAPPPYKQPPRVTTSASSTPQHPSSQGSFMKSRQQTSPQVQSHYQNLPGVSYRSPQHSNFSPQVGHAQPFMPQAKSQNDVGPANKGSTYVNVPLLRPNFETETNSTKDDLALMHAPTHRRNPSNTSYDTNMANLRNGKSHNRRGTADKNRANKINSNRFSCGDFSLVFSRQEQLVRQEKILLSEPGDAMSSRNVLHKDTTMSFHQQRSDVHNSNQMPHNLVKASPNQSLGSPTRLEETLSSNTPQYNMPPSKNSLGNSRQVPPALKHPSSSTGDLLPGIDLDTVAAMMQGGKEHLSTSMSSLGGFGSGNLNSGNSNRATVGRTLAGVLSGAAANIKSRFSNLSAANNSMQSSSPTADHTKSTCAAPTLNTSTTSTYTHGTIRDSSQSPTLQMSSEDKFVNHQPSYSSYQHFSSQFQRQQANHMNQWSSSTSGKFSNNQSVEQLAPSALPTTVPGADGNEMVGVGGFGGSSNSSIPASVQSLSFASSQSTPYAFGYPQRPDSRPQGPRDPPSHFQRKQEYL